MAGHSKFANIKHRKEKNDAAKGRVFTKIGREIAVSVKTGGIEIANNSRLRDAVAWARSVNMPADVIERSIKKAAGAADLANYESVTYEGYGPKGVAVIVFALTDNKNRTVANIRNAFTKGGGNMGQTGCVGFLFQKKGRILVERAAWNATEDEALALVLDAGAEDLIITEEGFEIITSPENFENADKALENVGVERLFALITQIPSSRVLLTDPEDVKKMKKLLDLLDEDDDVQNFNHNADF